MVPHVVARRPIGRPHAASLACVGARRILDNAALRAVADLGGKLASIALFAVMGRRLGDEGLGVYTFALSFVTLVTTFSGFGYKTVLTREVARDRERVHELLADTLALQAALSLPVLAVALVVAPLLGIAPGTQLVVGLLGVAVVAEVLMGTLFAVAQAYERLGILPVVLISQRWATAAAGIALLLSGADVVAVAVVYLAGALGALALCWVLLRRRIVRPRLDVRPARWRGLFRAALPIGLAGVFTTITFRVDTTLLAVYDTIGTVGQYGTAYRLFESTLFLSWAIGAATYPVFSRSGPGRGGPLRPVVEGAYKLSLALALPLAAGAAVMAGPVIRAVYGPGYGGGAEALVLLAPAILAYPVSYVGEHLFLSQDRQGTLLRLHGAVALATVAAGLIVVPALGLRGAALLTSAAEGFTAVVLVVLGARLCGGLAVGRVAGGPVLATTAMVLVMLPLRETLAAVPLGAVAYVVVLLGWERARHPDDAALLVTALRRRRAPAAEAST